MRNLARAAGAVVSQNRWSRADAMLHFLLVTRRLAVALLGLPGSPSQHSLIRQQMPTAHVRQLMCDRLEAWRPAEAAGQRAHMPMSGSRLPVGLRCIGEAGLDSPGMWFEWA